MSRYGLIVDVNRCIGCYACVVACKSENHTRPGIAWIRIDVEEKGEFPKVSRTYKPMLCMECSKMPCAEACPMGAIFREENGIVLINEEQCRCGQSMCAEACPYGAISINRGPNFYFEEEDNPGERAAYEVHRDGVAEKCTLCSHRLKQGTLPFCVNACPTKALLFGDLGDPESEISRLVSSGKAQPHKGDRALDVSVIYLNA